VSIALIIERDPCLGKEIADALKSLWDPLVVRRWEIGLAYVEHESIGVAVIDIDEAPDDFDILKRVTRLVPTIVFGEPSARKEALETGAYSYLAKPPDLHELVNLVRTASRRSSQAQMRTVREELRFGDLVLDPTAVDAVVDGVEVGLTPSQFHLLHTLALSAGQPLNRDDLIEAVSGRRNKSSRSIDTFVKAIREKLRCCLPEWVFIHSHPGQGYEFRPIPRTEVEDQERLFTREILPSIQQRNATELARFTGLSSRYCHAVKKGESVPHVRHWEAFRAAGQG
jgi:DNA-binding response OmpR family regulator